MARNKEMTSAVLHEDGRVPFLLRSPDILLAVTKGTRLPGPGEVFRPVSLKDKK
jgi:hypothetical protein